MQIRGKISLLNSLHLPDSLLNHLNPIYFAYKSQFKQGRTHFYNEFLNIRIYNANFVLQYQYRFYGFEHRIRRIRNAVYKFLRSFKNTVI